MGSLLSTVQGSSYQHSHQLEEELCRRSCCDYLHPHFTDNNIEAQKGSWKVVESGSEPLASIRSLHFLTELWLWRVDWNLQDLGSHGKDRGKEVLRPCWWPVVRLEAGKSVRL